MSKRRSRRASPHHFIPFFVWNEERNTMKLSPSSPSVVLLLATTLAITYTTTTAFSPSLGNTHSHSTCLSARKKSDDDQKDAKRAALDGVLSSIERTYGRGSVVRLGDADHMAVECISSGALTLGTSILLLQFQYLYPFD